MSCLKYNISETAGSRRMKSTPIQLYAIGLTLNIPIDFAFSPRLSFRFFLLFLLKGDASF